MKIKWTTGGYGCVIFCQGHGKRIRDDFRNRNYISDHGLEMPSNQSIKPLWNTVARDILPNPSTIADDDIKKLISGLASVVDGLGSLRTHTSSAHGRGKAEPPVGIAEALLAIHGSQALVLYMIQKRNKR
jgi:hypothetical protein